MSFEEHPRLETPPDETVIWRYMDLAKLLDLFENQRLWFCRVDLHEDPREGQLTPTELGEIRRASGEYAEHNIRASNAARQELYVNSWHKSSCESMAMWRLYGGNGCGVAVVAPIGKVKLALSDVEKPVYISDVDYLKWGSDARNPNNVIAMSARKSDSYGHENELRLIRWEGQEAQQSQGANPPLIVDIPAITNDMADALLREFLTITYTLPELRQFAQLGLLSGFARKRLRDRPRGLSVAIDPAVLLGEVVVGPLEPWRVGLVRSLLARYDVPGDAVRRSSLTPDPE